MLPNRVDSTIYERLIAAMAPEYRSDINVVLEFDGVIDEQRLDRALLAAIAADPLWGYRFVEHWRRPYWERPSGTERPQLVTVHETEDVATSLQALNRRLPESACQATILRSKASDTVWFLIDHRLADGTSARLLVQQIQRYYAQNVESPDDHAAPLVRRTMDWLRGSVSVGQRWQFLKANRRHRARMKQSTFRLPASTGAEPMPAQVLRLPADLSESLAERALRVRATVPMLVHAASCLAACEVANIPEGCDIPLNTPVDLRRYLPEESRQTSAAFLLGLVVVWWQRRSAARVQDVLSEIRDQFAAQRGRTFGLPLSALSVDLPVLREISRGMPYAIFRRQIRRRLLGGEQPSTLTVTDVGSVGNSRDPWGERRLTCAYSGFGPMSMPGVAIAISQFDSQCVLSIGSGASTTFVQAYLARLQEHLRAFIR